MCFSAPASFTASAALASMGVALVSRVKDRRLLPLAMIPWFYALQQAAEGVVWLNLPETSIAKNIFLFFAYVFWPIWNPFALYLTEQKPLRKQLLMACLGIGLCVSSLLSLLISDTVPIVYSHSIHYLENTPFDAYSGIGLVFYAIASVAPFFISSLRRAWIVGVLIVLSGIATFFLERVCFVSLWCFWAALISLSLFFIIGDKTPQQKN